MNLYLLLAETTLPPYVDEIVVILIKLFGAALVALAALAVRKLGKKWGIEETEKAEDVSRMIASEAIAYADRWAKQQDTKPTGPQKLEAALNRAIEIDAKIGVTEKLSKSFANRIEGMLELGETEGIGNAN